MSVRSSQTSALVCRPAPIHLLYTQCRLSLCILPVKQHILTLEGTVTVVRTRKMCIWARDTWCHRVRRGNNSPVPLEGMVGLPVYRVSAFFPAKACCAFRRPPGRAGSGAGRFSQGSRKPKRVGRHCLPHGEVRRWF